MTPRRCHRRPTPTGTPAPPSEPRSRRRRRSDDAPRRSCLRAARRGALAAAASRPLRGGGRRLRSASKNTTQSRQMDCRSRLRRRYKSPDGSPDGVAAPPPSGRAIRRRGSADRRARERRRRPDDLQTLRICASPRPSTAASRAGMRTRWARRTVVRRLDRRRGERPSAAAVSCPRSSGHRPSLERLTHETRSYSVSTAAPVSGAPDARSGRRGRANRDARADRRDAALDVGRRVARQRGAARAAHERERQIAHARAELEHGGGGVADGNGPTSENSSRCQRGGTRGRR